MIADPDISTGSALEICGTALRSGNTSWWSWPAYRGVEGGQVRDEAEAQGPDLKDAYYNKLRGLVFFILTISVLVAQSCPTLCNPTDYSPPGSSVHGILQKRVLEQVAIPSSRGPTQPRDRNQVSCIAGKFFTIWTTRKPNYMGFKTQLIYHLLCETFFNISEKIGLMYIYHIILEILFVTIAYSQSKAFTSLKWPQFHEP